MELGESSAGTSSANEIWAKLVPSDSRYSDVEIRSNEVVISSAITSSSLEKHGWCKISRNSDQCSASLQNKSSSTILVDESEVQHDDDIVINCGSEIVPGPSREGYLSYRFKVMPRPEFDAKLLKVNIDSEHAKCSICLNIWHDVVTVAPCLHNFCNGCFSEWLRRSQEKHVSVLCPQCRAVVQFVGRNHFLHCLEEDLLKADSSLRRSDEEIALLESYASIKSNLVVPTGNKNRRKRQRAPLEGEIVGVELPCPQCGAEFGGFCCNHRTVHLQCQACGGMMPSRPDFGVPQHCVGCDRAFCGAYWHAVGVFRSDSHPVCSHDTFKRISERTVSRIPYLAHEKNRHEQDITERCIRQMGKSLQDIISFWIEKLDGREIDRSRMALNHAETITSSAYVCNECYDKLVSYLLYWFRISIPKYFPCFRACELTNVYWGDIVEGATQHIPADVISRQDCWYGYTCRTQHHNEEHARKRNHVCRPTRGSAFP